MPTFAVVTTEKPSDPNAMDCYRDTSSIHAIEEAEGPESNCKLIFTTFIICGWTDSKTDEVFALEK